MLLQLAGVVRSAPTVVIRRRRTLTYLATQPSSCVATRCPHRREIAHANAASPNTTAGRGVARTYTQALVARAPRQADAARSPAVPFARRCGRRQGDRKSVV